MSIHERVFSFIYSPQPERFDSLSIDVFRHQYVSVPAYRKHCELLGVYPDQVLSSQEIPMVSTVAFKYAELHAPGAAEASTALTFLTSGTTRGRERRGRHVVARPDIYRASAIAHLRAMMFPDGVRMRMLAIHPTADRMPESSLSTMISWCIDEFAHGPNLCVADRGGLDVPAALDFLGMAAADRAPVCILGTTAAYAAIFEGLAGNNETIALPQGSRMMDTGGAKGQVVPLTASEVLDRATARLGIDPDFVINEYGMTELCSQLYDATRLNSRSATPAGERVKVAPPWMRPAAMDPVTMRRLPDGTRGLLGFVDLANVSSVSAILTEDFGIVEGSRVRILGRAIAGGPRGCALSIAQFEQAARA
jgi:hypothetical protein